MAESDLIRGNVDTVILKVLYDGDRYGFDLIKQIKARSNGQWDIKQSTVYACLKRLEKQGFVSSYWDSSESEGGRRKYFSLTDRGREVFITYRNEWERSRDLFGDLIAGSEPILPVDDFSDVEEESYSIPKRRTPRPSKPRGAVMVKPESAPITSPIVEDSAETVIADEPIDSVEQVVEDTTTESIADEPAQSERYERPTAYSSFATTFNDYKEDNYDRYDRQQEYVQEQFDFEPATTAADPREILEKLYATTAVENESYADARKRAQTDERERRAADIQPVQTAPAPAPVVQERLPERPAAAPIMPAVTQSSGLILPEEESLARREYKDILNDLVDRLEVSSPDMHDGVHATEVIHDDEAAAAAVDEDGKKIEVRMYKIKQDVAELGNDLSVRDHNNSAREYAQKYYYYNTRLMMTHYTVMCVAMFLLGLTLFLTFFLGLKMRLEYDYILYVMAGLLPIFMFIGSVIVFACNPDKKKRINANFKFSVAIRIVIFIQVAVVIYCVNLIWGMPIGFSAAYIPSLVLPLAYALFIPISEIIFMGLLKSGRYAVE